MWIKIGKGESCRAKERKEGRIRNVKEERARRGWRKERKKEEEGRNYMK